MPTDSELPKRTKAGSREAVARLYREYFPAVWRYVYAKLQGDKQATEDVVSETFLAAVERVQNRTIALRQPARWLTAVAKRQVAYYLRQKQRGNVRHLGDTHHCAVEPAVDGSDGEMRSRLADALESLPEEERLVLEWKYLDGCSAREIAQRLGRTERAAESVLYRARRSFRRRWNTEDSPGFRLEGE